MALLTKNNHQTIMGFKNKICPLHYYQSSLRIKDILQNKLMKA